MDSVNFLERVCISMELNKEKFDFIEIPNTWKDNVKISFKNNNIPLYRIEYNKISDIEDWIEKNKELILNG